jgi:ATP-dependent Lhr-like helicase
VGNPQQILRWLQGTSQREGALVDPPRPKSKRELQVLLRPSVGQLAEQAATMGEQRKSLVFCQSRAATEVLASRMRSEGIEVFVHHGSVAADERRAAEERFARGKNTAIICTSTLELGIDVGDLDKVFQLGAPSTVSSFLQRMGRTGRREGTVANTTFLCESGEEALQCAAVIELARQGWVESVEPSERCWPVLLHQLFAMALEHKGVTAERAWEQLSRCPDFRGVTRAEFDALIAHLCRKDYLFDASGRLVLGITAEREFGKKNFMEMYAVFSSPVLFHVETTAGQELGTIEQAFADRLSPKITAFLLAGRAWLVESVDLKKRKVVVTSAPAGTKPSWGGRVPQILGFELVRKMRELLLSDESLPYVRPEAMAALRELREEHRATLTKGGHAIVYEPGGARWWTWAGGKVNAALACAIGLRSSGWKCHWDNTGVRIDGDGIQWDTLGAVVKELGRFGFWEDEEVWKELLARLPEYRLSKFQRAMPERAAREMIGAYLLDWERARACAMG